MSFSLRSIVLQLLSKVGSAQYRSDFAWALSNSVDMIFFWKPTRDHARH